MARKRALEEYTKFSSGKILESIGLVEAIDELIEGDIKFQPIVSMLNNNLRQAFNNIEKMRKIISTPD